jgi:hypothetical protein
MTQEQCIRIATRALSIYLIIWAVSDVLALPHMIFTIRHYMYELSLIGNDEGKGLATRHYLRLEFIYLGEYLLRMLLWLIGARWLYSAGPWLQSFFVDAPTPGEPASAPQEA